MATKTITTCDRCRQEATKSHKLAIDNEERDLCHSCWQPLVSWLGRSNATVQGDSNRPKGFRGPGWIEVCPHHVPCGGSCPTPQYRRADR